MSFDQPYQHVLSLELDKSRLEVGSTNEPGTMYLQGLCDALELLITENEVKFEKYEATFEDRLDDLKKEKKPEALYVLAELRLQWAFVYLKFGHEFDAAWSIRQSYLLVQECKKKFPSFTPIRKTSGMLDVMLGSVPEKFQWILGLLNMKGSVENGLEELVRLSSDKTTIGFESALYHNLILGFVLQETEKADQRMDALLLNYPNKKLLLFLATTIAIKNSQSRKALSFIEQLEKLSDGLPLTYSMYLKGEVCLHGGEYYRAISSYTEFLNTYQGLNYVKDANYKIGICYLLMERSDEARKYFSIAKVEGIESAEADKYAARNLASDNLPNVKLSRIRYFTDGGYYDKAIAELQSVQSDELATLKDKTEFVYRKARLHHKLGELAEAKTSYNETIKTSGMEPWYFAPNACLQLGYILLEENNLDAAESYFEKALSYKRHEYKNSIDSKARSALAKIKNRLGSNGN